MKKNLLILTFLGFLVLPITAFGIGGDVGTIAQNIQTQFVIVGSAVVIIGWILTGIMFLTAAGDPTKLTNAKKALIACVIGTALVILAETAETFISGTL